MRSCDRANRTASVRVESPLTPRHSLGLVGMWEREDVGRVGIEYYFTGAQRLEANPYRIALEVVFDPRRAGRAQGRPVKVFLNAENLTDVRQTKFDPLVLPAQAIDGRWTVDALGAARRPHLQRRHPRDVLSGVRSPFSTIVGPKIAAYSLRLGTRTADRMSRDQPTRTFDKAGPDPESLTRGAAAPEGLAAAARRAGR